MKTSCKDKMINLYDGGAYLVNGTDIVPDNQEAQIVIKNKTGRVISKEEAARETIAFHILKEHNTSDNTQRSALSYTIFVCF